MLEHISETRPGGDRERAPIGSACDGLISPRDNLVAGLNQARARLDDHATVGQWILDLRERLERRRLIFLFADYSMGLEDLEIELEQLGRVRRALAWRPAP
jgi:hypothetical protein